MPLNPGVADILASPGAPTIVQNALGTGGAVTYNIVAVNAAGQDSLPSAATTTPTNTVATNVNVTLSWSPVPGAVAYRIIRNGNLQITVNGGQTSYTDNAAVSSTAYTAATVSSSALAPSGVSVVAGGKPTYTYTISATAPYATPTDWVVIRGSAYKTIKIQRIEFSGAATAATVAFVANINKHTVANTGGTSSSPTPIQHDSSDIAALATVLLYSVAPTISGTATVWKTIRITLPVVTPAGATYAIDRYVYDYASEPYEPLTLRGVAQECAINFNSVALLSGEVLDYAITWTEE